jgi:hypothetical protein
MATTRINWPAVLSDIGYQLGDGEPCSLSMLARELGIARMTLQGWIDGSEPKHADGEQLLDRWRSLTGKPREFAPLERRSLSGHAR